MTLVNGSYVNINCINANASSHNYFDDSDLKKQLLNHQQFDLFKTNLQSLYTSKYLGLNKLKAGKKVR